MKRKCYTEEFKVEAVKQVTERGHAVADVGAILWMSTYSGDQLITRYGRPEPERIDAHDCPREICQATRSAGSARFKQTYL